MINDDWNYEECPFTEQAAARISIVTARRKTTFKVPFRVFRLCVLGVLLPCFILSLVLYMRYRVYVEQLYPFAVSDMRMLDNRISTTWCERQVIKTNATFNAFLLPQSPTIAQTSKTMSMVRHLELEDDTKEYWGFYLLRGSTVTISTCVRWPGSSLIVIRGHKHLHECAYIGDNSSEELDELMEAIREGTYTQRNEKLPEENDAPSNDPDLMKRHRLDVQFHHPSHNSTTHQKHALKDDILDTQDITDPKVLRAILDTLNQKANKKQSTTKKSHMHIHRNSTIAKGEQKNFQIENDDDDESLTTASEEVLAELLKKLEGMGERGANILEKLNVKFNNKVNTANVDENMLADEKFFTIKGRQIKKSTVQFDDNIDKARRRRRDLILKTASTDLSMDDQDNDYAIEEEFFPDGIADHHAVLNESKINDMSNSEFWSSFSSSEEALLNCAGLILNLPLTPHRQCRKDLSDDNIEAASLANKITYKVPTNGYYFFVFNSENEVQTNYIRVNFHIDKTMYNVTNRVSECSNSTEQCTMNLRFFSNEKVVMELPIKEDEDLWNQEYVVISTCEPRTTLYVVCVISVPILIMVFAFQ